MKQEGKHRLFGNQLMGKQITVNSWRNCVLDSLPTHVRLHMFAYTCLPIRVCLHMFAY